MLNYQRVLSVSSEDPKIQKCPTAIHALPFACSRRGGAPCPRPVDVVWGAFGTSRSASLVLVDLHVQGQNDPKSRNNPGIAE